MQETTTDRDQDTGATSTEAPGGLLEDPRELIIENNGMPAAVLIEELLTSPYEVKGTVLKVHRYSHLRWSNTAAQLLLQGASVQSILGTEWFLADGYHRPVYSPQPGVDHPILVEVISNPDKKSSVELLKLVMG